MHRMETLIKNKCMVKTENEKVRVVLRNGGYPEWVLKEGELLENRQKRKIDRRGVRKKWMDMVIRTDRRN